MNLMYYLYGSQAIFYLRIVAIVIVIGKSSLLYMMDQFLQPNCHILVILQSIPSKIYIKDITMVHYHYHHHHHHKRRVINTIRKISLLIKYTITT